MPSPRARSRSPSLDTKRSSRPYAKQDRSPRSPRRRSPSPFTKRGERSYPQEDRYPRHTSQSPSPYTRKAERSYTRNDRSPSPRLHHRSRSRSPRPRRDGKPRRSGTGGFRWKEKPRVNWDEDMRDSQRLERGYRDEGRPRHRSRERERDYDGRRDDIEAKFGRQKSPTRDGGKGDDMRDKFGNGEEPPKKKKKEKVDRPVVTSQEMIIVNVNDRLGTKTSVPCLASDPIKLFKAQVAARIGRQPHEIMLKRQGERPFKDQLSLEDYGVSNGVQLDLEIDTGD